MLTIVCIGDSITEGHNGYDNDVNAYVGDDTITSQYEYHLFKRLENTEPNVSVVMAGSYPITKFIGTNFTVINAGNGGTSTKFWRDNFTNFVLNQNADCVIFFGNANDPSSSAVGGQQTEQQTKDNYIYMINTAISNGIIPVVGTNTPRSLTWSNSNSQFIPAYINFDSWVKQYANEQAVDLIDFHFMLSDSNGYLLSNYDSDGIHLNISGYEAMANGIDLNVILHPIHILIYGENINVSETEDFIKIVVNSKKYYVPLTDSTDSKASKTKIHFNGVTKHFRKK